jgi:hypothetical protein
VSTPDSLGGDGVTTRYSVIPGQIDPISSFESTQVSNYSLAGVDEDAWREAARRGARGGSTEVGKGEVDLDEAAEAVIGDADSDVESVVTAIRQKTPRRWLTLEEIQAEVERDREIREREKWEDRKAFRSLFLVVQSAVRKLEIAYESEDRVASALDRLEAGGAGVGGCAAIMNRNLRAELRWQ